MHMSHLCMCMCVCVKGRLYAKGGARELRCRCNLQLL